RAGAGSRPPPRPPGPSPAASGAASSRVCPCLRPSLPPAACRARMVALPLQAAHAGGDNAHMLDADPSSRVAVVGGGPAGLIAAERLRAAGLAVDLYEAQGSRGRKFLIAGTGGRNLTHSDPRPLFASRYRDRKSTRLNSSHVKISYA